MSLIVMPRPLTAAAVSMAALVGEVVVDIEDTLSGDSPADKTCTGGDRAPIRRGTAHAAPTGRDGARRRMVDR